MTLRRAASICWNSASASRDAIDARRSRLPGYGSSWLTMTPMFAVGSVPSPAPGQRVAARVVAGRHHRIRQAALLRRPLPRGVVPPPRGGDFRVLRQRLSHDDPASDTPRRRLRERRERNRERDRQSEKHSHINLGQGGCRTRRVRDGSLLQPQRTALGNWRGRSLDQQAGETRGEVETARAGRRGVGTDDRVAEIRECGEPKKARSRRQARVDLHPRLGRSAWIRRVSLVAAAARGDASRGAAVVLLGRAERVHLVREHRQPRRHEDRQEQGDRRQGGSKRLHSANACCRDYAMRTRQRYRVCFVECPFVTAASADFEARPADFPAPAVRPEVRHCTLRAC